MNKIQEISCLNELPNDEICKRAKLDTGTLCNYKCFFCYYKSKLNELTNFDEIKKRIDKLYQLGCREFDLSGGESSIHPDFFKILEYLNSLNVKISMLSNGYFFSKFENLEKAKNLGLSEILFSVHSVDEVHDEIVGKSGAFEKILKAILNAKKLNLKIRINSTITNKNLHLIDNKFFDFIEKIQPFELNFLPLNYFDENTESYNIDYENLLKPIKNFIDKSSIKLINVRYVPFCYMKGYEKNVVGYYQHIFDIYDWNIAYYHYKESNKENLLNLAKNSRIYNYNKSNKCLKCKYFYICDGIEPQVNSDFKPEPGEKIKDILFYRHNFYS